MSTRSRPTTEDVRARLLDAAEALLADRRPATITSRDIARAARLSDGVLYNHFADKGDLLLAALVRRFERLTAAYAADPVATGTGTIAEGVAEVVRRGHAIHVAVLPMLANLAGEPALLHRFLVEIHRPPLGGDVFAQPVRAWLATEQAAGRVRAGDLDGLVHLIVGAALLQGLIDLLGHRAPAERDRQLAAIADALVPALLSHPGGLDAPHRHA
ncbi:MAG TPA: TetR/AcrR family transcriptional regulator [Candidatus Limnocylindrales bacterium]|nr:TetR/AcrR family transcriptional regulator [Candidatus Limnocylindrales bacterium]